jgi:hypothetical protein
MSSKKWCVLLCAIAFMISIGVAGCPAQPSKTVLAGTWTLAGANSANPSLTSTQLNFDSSGNLVSVTYVFNNATATKTLANTSTSVTGTAVTVASTTAGFTLAFDGTLNADDTLITGTASFTLVIGNTTITLPTGTATLIKGALTGNTTAGQTLFTAECVTCHTAVSLAPVADNIVSDLGTLNTAMASIVLTGQQILDLQAFLATQ